MYRDDNAGDDGDKGLTDNTIVGAIREKENWRGGCNRKMTDNEGLQLQFTNKHLNNHVLRSEIAPIS